MNYGRISIEETMRRSLTRYVVDNAGCWIWQGARDKWGYGVVNLRGKHYGAHRIAFFLHNGEWPEPMALHSCDNPACVNPEHLRAGTAADNARDIVERGRRSRFLSKPEWVFEVKRLLATGMRVIDVSKAVNVPAYAVSHIKCGRYWRHVQV